MLSVAFTSFITVSPVHTPPGTLTVPALSMAPGGMVTGPHGTAGRDVVESPALALKLAQTPFTGVPTS